MMIGAFMNISFGNKYKNHGESQIRGDGFPACQGTVPWQAHIGMMVIVVKMGGA